MMKCVTLVCLVLSQIFVVFSVSIEEEVQTLKAQLNALLQRRQEDYNQLEESLRKTFDKNVEISNLKNEIRELRSVIDALRAEPPCATCANGNRLKNEQLTVQWLANSISEIRGEITELAQSFNSTVELQQQQTLTTDISIVQNDIVSLRHDVETLRGEVTKSGAKLASMSQDVEVSRQLSHSTAAITANLTDKLQVAISDWSRTAKSIQKKKDKVFKRMVVVNDDPLDMKVVTMTDGNGRYRRHSSRALKKQLVDVEEVVEDLQLSQNHIKHRVAGLEAQLSADVGAQETRLRNGVEPRLARLESLVEGLNGSLGEISAHLGGQEKLHTSMLELLESVENIETKVDTTTPDLKREISKLEFSLAQITSTAALLKEDQDNQKITVKALGESLSAMQNKVANSQNQILKLNNKITNITSMSNGCSTICRKNSSTETVSTSKILEGNDTFQRWSSSIKPQYSSVVNQLPKDCDSVNGASGLYLVSPDGDAPILVYCEIQTAPTKIAYTVIQRRIDGQQDFNKNWDEYARGFGELNGEFWLGNEAIHRLTRNNDTMARIDFKDISGKPWFAEYSEFSVASRPDGYKLHVAGYNGNASDALEYQNRMQFSTVDSDRDISNTNCAANYEGGWWFSHCQHTNLNGKYNLGLTWFDRSRNEWIAVAFTEIKLKRKL